VLKNIVKMLVVGWIAKKFMGRNASATRPVVPARRPRA
jgi:hypothetical protein